MANDKAIMVDTTKCTACRACQVACKQWNQNKAEKTKNCGSYENPPSLGSNTWMRILFNEKYDSAKGSMQWLFTKHQCMHCTNAACVEVCPPNATTQQEAKLSDGSYVKRVATDKNKCIGCNYCRVACPFDVPGYNQKEKGIFRCTLCLDRLSNAPVEDKAAAPSPPAKVPAVAKPALGKPACVSACAPGTLTYGNRDELILKAEARVAELQKNGHSGARLYGKDELGGLKYMYILTDVPEAYGLPADPSVPMSVKVWKALTKPYGAIAAGGLVIALVVNGVINARNRGLEEKYKLGE